MSSTENYLEQLAAEAERIRQERAAGGGAPEPSTPAPSEELPLGAYYSPGSKLEGRDDFVATPDGWENEGSRFEVHRGKHEALIEGVYSSELDGGEDHREFTQTTSKKRYLLPGLIAAVVLAVPAVALVTGDDAPTEAPPSVTAPPSDPLNNFAVAFEKPLEKALPKAAKPPSYAITVASSGRYLVTSEGSRFSVGALPVRSSQEGCQVTLDTEFCLAGTVESAAGPLPVYYAKNLVTLPTLAEAAEFKKFKKPGTALSAQLVVDFAGGPTRFLSFVLPNSTGWFMAVPGDMEETALEDLKKSVRVSS